MFRHHSKILAGMFAIGMLAGAATAQTTTRGERPFRVTHYDVQLEPRLESGTVTGTVTLLVVVHRGDVASADTAITLDRGRLEIERVQEGASSRAFVVDGVGKRSRDRSTRGARQ